MARTKRKRVYLTRQTWPALLSVVFGLFMMIMPFVVAHGGYNGDIIIASPRLKTPFDKTLILIGGESVDGSIGIILNKPLSESQHEALSPFLRDSGLPIGYGGPLDVSEKVFVIEEKPVDLPGKGTYFDINTWEDAVRDKPDLLNVIRDSIKKGEQRYRLFTGFTGWSAFQLETEGLRHHWHSVTATHDLIFQTSPASTWDAFNDKESGKGLAPNQI